MGILRNGTNPFSHYGLSANRRVEPGPVNHCLDVPQAQGEMKKQGRVNNMGMGEGPAGELKT